jgi:predicted MFS family arabinose efflux permease
MAFACTASVANIYYNQPLLGSFAAQFGATALQASWVATAAQAGYGAGILFFLPIGDLVERRRLILVLTTVCAVLLAGIAAAPSLPLLILGHFLMGTAAVGAQVIIPFATDLVPAQARGRTVGFLMGGVLCGILLARTLAGFIGDWFGWRSLYAGAAVVMLVLALCLRGRLPHRPPALRMSYPQLMGTLFHLVRGQPRLWTSASISALSFASFMAFWTTLSFLMITRFHLGASEAGLFGIVGLAGALGAPLAGRLSDWKGSAFTVSMALLASLAGFGVMWFWLTIPGLIVGVFLMDLGVQSIQVAEQSKALSLVPEAKSRINTIYMVARFIGGAFGSFFGSAAWAHEQWTGVCVFAVGVTLVAMIIHRIGIRIDRNAPPNPPFEVDSWLAEV